MSRLSRQPESHRLNPAPDKDHRKAAGHRRDYITPHGLTALRKQLDQTRRRLAAMDPAAEGASLAIDAAERDVCRLRARLKAAIPVDGVPEPDRVGFGASVDLVYPDGTAHHYRIVGEDEADPKRACVGWASPLARALDGARAGDRVIWKRHAGDFEVEVLAIDYRSPR